MSLGVLKHHFDGFIKSNKARLVAKRFTQMEGVDYHDTFSLTTRIIIVCCLIALATAQH